MANIGENQATASMPSVKTEAIDCELLPLIYEIMRSIEKDTLEPGSAKSGREAQSSDTAQKMTELKNKFRQCREQIRQLPGIEHSEEEQLKRLDALRQQLVLKKSLLQKYRNLCHFEVPKL